MNNDEHMSEGLNSIDERKEPKPPKGAQDSSAIMLRWIVLFFAALLIITEPPGDGKAAVLPWIFAVIIVFQFLASKYALKCRKSGKRALKPRFYSDAVILSLLAYFNGGIESDIYILLLFLIGYCGIFAGTPGTVRLTFFCVLAYSVASFSAASDKIESFNCWRLVIRDALIVITGFGISRVNAEIRKYYRLHKKEFRLARTDRLTGLANRHYFDQKLRCEVQYADRSGEPLNVLMLDLDNFKQFNDSYGHVWGDRLLAIFSDIIRRSVREADIPVRYGGEEFLILIRDLDIMLAKNVAERIRRQLEKQRIYIGDDSGGKRVTVSCGIAQYPAHSDNIKEVVEMADRALYKAKELGKNRVLTYDEIGSQ